jgi:NADH-quinone oxidoreductase subunit H
MYNFIFDFIFGNFLFIFLYFVFFLVFILLSVAIATLMERKLLGSMQRRKGPNVVGLFGFLQPFADALKAMLKENVIPRDADAYIFLLAPVFTFFCSLKVWGTLPLDSIDYPVYSVNGVLYLLIILSFGAYGIIFAGWSSILNTLFWVDYVLLLK